MRAALKQKESAKKLNGGAQCFFQLPEESRRVKRNQISPIKRCLCWGTSQRCCSDSVNPFAVPFCPLSKRPICSSVVPREVYWGNRHHYSLALDRLKVTASKFGKFPFAAQLTGLAIRGQWERHSFRVSTCILLNSSTSHIMSSPAFCGSSSHVELTFSPAKGLCVRGFWREDLGYWIFFSFHTTDQLKIWEDAMEYHIIHRAQDTRYWN